MPPSESVDEPIRSQLDRVLSSAGFARNERLSGFLRFVVEKQLAGESDQIKESIIGVEVFGRRPDYDVRQDSAVRTEAAKLRGRLAEYYAGEGSADPLIIELPKGGYIPTFREVERASAPVVVAPPPAPLNRRLQFTLTLACLCLAFVGAGWWVFRPPKPPIPVAVLPFVNLNQDPASDYFADGLTDEIIRNLSIIDGLAVRSRTSSFTFKGKPPDVREAGKQLNAEYILEGSVLHSAQQLRVNVQLIRVRDDYPVWAAKFDRQLTDVFAIQEEISRGIVNNLRLKLGNGRRRYETSVDAYDLYLRARSLQLGGAFGYDRSVVLLHEAIAADPSFAPAYAALAVAHAVRSGQFRFNIAAEASNMRAAAIKANELDPLLAEAHNALGMAYARDAKWKQSEESFRRAIEIDPGRSESFSDFAMYLLLPLNRIDEAVQQLRLAEKADPLSHLARFTLAYSLVSAGQYDEAATRCKDLPANSLGHCECLGRALLGQGKSNEAIEVLVEAFKQDLVPGSQIRGELGYAYGLAGRREEAEKLAIATSPINPFNHALIYAGLGDKDRTFEALNRAATGGPVRIGRTLTFPEFALLQGDPRLKSLRRKVGLPD